MNLTCFLDDIEARIDPQQEELLAAHWETFCELGCREAFFSPRRIPAPAGITWPQVCINDAFRDMDLMLYAQLKTVSDQLASGGGLLLSVRANYGTAIIPSMFGADVFALADDADTLPGAKYLEDGVDALKAIVAENRIDFDRGLAKDVFAFGYRWKELTKSYPKISKYVYLYNPDLQGPFPLVDILAGSDLYLSLFDEPEFVHDAMRFVTDTYIAFTQKWQAEFPAYSEKYAVEWGLLHKGRTILRNDAVMNLSEEMYREFVMPYDKRIFDTLGGGMHFCGRGDHYIGAACEIDSLSCINLSQPELNDMEKIYRVTIEQGKTIIGMVEHEIQRAGSSGRNLMGRVHSGAALSAYRNWGKQN